MKFLSILILFFVASTLKVEAQSFVWESDPEICDIPFVKIKETKSGEFFIIGNNECKVACLKLNKYGDLIWRNSPKTFSRGLTDFISYDDDKTFYVLGIGDAFPSRSLLFNINLKGQIIFEKEVYSLTYYPEHFNNQLYNNTIVMCGYDFYPYPKISPILELRNLKGDTLRKIEYSCDNCSRAKKLFSLKNKSGFLMFCGHNV